MPQEISNVNFFNAGSSKKEQEVEELIQKLWGTKYINK
jgi:hypothetical protein